MIGIYIISGTEKQAKNYFLPEQERLATAFAESLRALLRLEAKW